MTFAIILIIAFILLPGGTGFLDGVPLSALHELILLTAFIGIFSFLPLSCDVSKERGWYMVLTICLFIKALLGITAVPQGLASSYYTTHENKITLERSTEFIHLNGATRIDKDINFRMTGYDPDANPFPVWFFNDFERFNKSVTEMSALPFTATWRGYLFVPSISNTLKLETNGTAKVILDKQIILRSDEKREHVTGTSIKTPGLLPIEITYTNPALENPFLRLSWKGPRRVASLAPYLFLSAQTEELLSWVAFHQTIEVVTKTVWALAVILLLIQSIELHALRAWTKSARSWCAMGATILFGAFLKNLIARADTTTFNFLSSGNDPIRYETFARHLQFTNDWAMRIYETGDYYWQILYYYFLAFMHSIFGEALLPIIFIQLISIIITSSIIFYLFQILYKTNARLVPFIAMFSIAFFPFIQEYAFELFPIGTLLQTASILLLILSSANLPYFISIISTVSAGIVTGLAVILRTNFAANLLIMLLWITYASQRRLQSALLFCAAVIVIVIPFIARNIAVTGHPVLLSKSAASANFIISTPIPSEYIPHKPLPKWLEAAAHIIFDGRADRTIQWILEHPRKYGSVLYKKWQLLLGKDEGLYNGMLALGIIFIFASLIIIIQGNIRHLVIVGIVGAQIITLLILSLGGLRYTLPLIPFILMSILIPLAYLEDRLFIFLKHAKRSYNEQTIF